MIEVCVYCKDTHGRHRLGCPYLEQQEEIAKWRSKHGYKPDLPLRTDGIHHVDECGKVPVGHVYQGVTGPAEMTATEVNQRYKDKEFPIHPAIEAGLDAALDILAKQNPKDIAGSKKPAYDLLALPNALNLMAEVMKHGADKYGPFNWRGIPITAPAYFAAVGRHWAAMASGEWNDPESGLPHAAHIMATCAIMLDAQAHGTLKDGPKKA